MVTEKAQLEEEERERACMLDQARQAKEAWVQAEEEVWRQEEERRMWEEEDQLTVE